MTQVKRKIALIGLILGIVLLALVSTGTLSYAEPAANLPMSLTQPDGTTLNCLASGDEFFNYLHDANGYYIMQHPANGYYVYAATGANGKLTASNLVALDNGNYYNLLLNKITGIAPPGAGGSLMPFGNVGAAGIFRAQASSTAITIDDIDLSVNSDLVWVPAGPAKSTPPPVGVSNEVGPVRPSRWEGVMENVIILIAFSDQSDAITTGMVNDVNSIFNGPAPSLKNYLKTVSGGVFEVNSTLLGLNDATVLMYQDPHPRMYYEPYNATTNPIGHTGTDTGPNGRTAREQLLMRNAVRAVQNSALLAGKNLDVNNDGDVDSVMFIIMGASGTDILWAHKWALYVYTEYLNGKQVWGYASYAWDRLFNMGGPGGKNLSTICHETLHVFDFPDLYRYNPPSPGTPVGQWDIMSSHFGNLQPQIPNTHTVRKYAGWGDPVPEITQNGRYTLSPIGSKNGTTAYAINTTGANQFIMLEYRSSANGSGYDLPYTPSSYYCPEGLVISRINTAFEGNYNRDVRSTDDEVYVYRPGETGINVADDWSDYAWASLSAGSGRTSFGNDTATTPWNNQMIYLYNGANTQYLISNVSAAGDTISFDVKIKAIVPNTVSYLAGSNGTLSAIYNSAAFTSGSTVTSGSAVAFTATPASNYIVDTWYVDGAVAQAGGNTYNLSGITASQTVTATFKHNPANVVADPVVTTAPTVVTGLANSASVTVNMSTSTSGATIHYTTDGTTPNMASPAYSTPLTVTAGTTSATTKRIIAYAVKGTDVPSQRVYIDISFNAAGVVSPPAITVTSTGLGSLKVGQAVSGSITYTLANGTYVAQSAITQSDFAVVLPPGLTIYAVSRSSGTEVIAYFSGTPTTANASTTNIAIPASISMTNVTGASVPVPVTGTVTASAVAKGDGAAVSVPLVSGLPTHDSITVNAVTITPVNGQIAEYAISTGTATPGSGWQTGTNFTGLAPSTTYYVFARTMSDANYNTGTAQRSLGIMTAATPLTPAITVTSTGLDNLKVGQAVSGSITYTLANGTYVAQSAITQSDFAVVLPPGLTIYAVSRSSGTEVIAYFSGTPTTANASTTNIAIPASISMTNVAGASASVPVTGTATASAVAKGDGAAVSNQPIPYDVTPSSVSVYTVSNAAYNGQTVEYAISTGTAVPGSGWQTGTNFTGLTPSTAYWVFARTASNADYDAGTAQRSASITTLGALNSACEIHYVNSPYGGTFNGTTVMASVSSDTAYADIDVTVSPGAAWALYTEPGCYYEIYDRRMGPLTAGANNAAYIKVTAADGVTNAVYEVLVYRDSGYIVNPSLGGSSGIGYRGSGTVQSNVPIVEWWTSGMSANIRSHGDGYSATVNSQRTSGFGKSGTIEVFARTDANELLRYRISVTPSFGQWLIIILLFGFLWY